MLTKEEFLQFEKEKTIWENWLEKHTGLDKKEPIVKLAVSVLGIIIDPSREGFVNVNNSTRFTKDFCLFSGSCLCELVRLKALNLYSLLKEYKLKEIKGNE